MKQPGSHWIASSLALLAMTFAAPAFADEETPPELQKLQLENRLGNTIPLDLKFQNEAGKEAALKNYFDGKKPVVLMLVYFGCPNICSYLLRGANETFQKMNWALGKEYEVVVVSINPKETPDLAAAAKKKLSGNFLTGKEPDIKALADSVGFKFYYDEEAKQYAHPAALFVLTPEGKLARVLSGIEFSPRDLKLALLEATEGKVGNVMDRLLMFCYRYDPKTNKYALFATRLMKAGGAVTLAVLGVLLFRGVRRKGGRTG